MLSVIVLSVIILSVVMRASLFWVSLCWTSWRPWNECCFLIKIKVSYRKTTFLLFWMKKDVFMLSVVVLSVIILSVVMRASLFWVPLCWTSWRPWNECRFLPNQGVLPKKQKKTFLLFQMKMDEDERWLNKRFFFSFMKKVIFWNKRKKEKDWVGRRRNIQHDDT
jgi:hypothetical protein